MVLTAIALLLPQPFKIAQDGVAKCSIYIPATSCPGAQHGAEELQTVLAQMTGGAQIPIVHTRPKGPQIDLLDSKRLGDEEYIIKSEPNRITITGGAPRGVLYGCIGLLQDHLDCHWYTATVSSIPHRTDLTLPNFLDHGKPAFEYREPFFTEAWNQEWAIHNRCNGNSMDLPNSVGGKVQYGGPFVHSSYDMVPPDKYFKDHPEYYALVNGKRTTDQLELTNPEVAKIATQTVESWIKQNPDATLFSVSQNDNWNQSQSPESVAINREEGAPSGLLLRFVNKVASAVAQKYPHALIDTLAYQWTEKPPKITRPLPNVRIRLAPIGADYAHALDKSKENKTPFDNLVAWGNITHQLYIWSYCTNFAHYLQPLPDLDEIAGDIPLFKKHGVVGVFYEGDYAEGGGGDMAELKSYLIGQLLWNPAQNPQHLIKDYCDHVYGPAAPFILDWINLIHSPARDHGVPAYIYDAPTSPYFSAALLAKGDDIFSNAIEAAANDPAALDQVERAQLGLQYVELEQAKKDSPQFKLLASIVAEKIKKYGITQTSEGGDSKAFLKSIGQ